MKFKKLMTTVALFGAMSFGATAASANTGAAAAFDAHYVTNSDCFSCHVGTPGALHQLGTDWKSVGGTKDAGPTTAAGWTTLDGTYSATYGGVEPAWVAPAAAASSSGGGGGCVTASVTTPLMMILGMLALGFFVRRKKD